MALGTTVQVGQISNKTVRAKVKSYSVDKDALYITLLGTANRNRVFKVADNLDHYKTATATIIAAYASSQYVTIEYPGLAYVIQSQPGQPSAPKVYGALTVGVGSSPYIN